MQYCFNCGEELGVYEVHAGDMIDTCGKPECERAAGECYQQEEEEARYQAEKDHYDRYR